MRKNVVTLDSLKVLSKAPFPATIDELISFAKANKIPQHIVQYLVDVKAFCFDESFVYPDIDSLYGGEIPEDQGPSTELDFMEDDFMDEDSY